MQKVKSIILVLALLLMKGAHSQASIEWGDEVVVNDQPLVSYDPDTLKGEGEALKYRSQYGSEYGRLLELKDGSWLAVYTISRNLGYEAEKDGGFELQVVKSTDNGRSWKKMTILADEGRDLDNAQMVQLVNGSILLAARSVRWQESYRLPVFKSQDGGKSWRKISTIDSNEGAPGELGSPDKGVYEPHMLLLKDEQLAVVYANETHVVEDPSYSQIISQRISTDQGESWGEEGWIVYKEGKNNSRPGMPVWTKMKNGRYILVYEICGPEGCEIYSKTSPNGTTWPKGFGQKVPGHVGGPFIMSMEDGTLILTSNKGAVSTSLDYGKTWHQTRRAWDHKKKFADDWTQTIWSSLYELEPGKLGILTTVQREKGGHCIKLRFGRIQKN